MRSARHVPRDHCLAPERVDAPIGPGGRYGRMFDLPPLEADERLLHELGAAGGGVVAADPESYLAVEPDWSPTLPAPRRDVQARRPARPLSGRRRRVSGPGRGGAPGAS